MSMMGYTIKIVNSHIEVFDGQNRFIESTDTEQEAMQDIQKGEI